MKNSIKLLSLLFAALILLTTLASCDRFVLLDKGLEINVSVLNGSTGFGAAKLISDSEEGKTALNYNFTVEKLAENVTKGLINGSIDIAALPTNAAAALYKKTEGGVKIAAVNTLGVLYLVTNGEKLSINNISELEGKTIYCPDQNPAFIFKAICNAHGVNVTIDTYYAKPEELRDALVNGMVDMAVIPEPMVTIAKSKNNKLTTALDLTEEWEKAYGENTLLQGCIVVRTEWAEAHPQELEQFLAEYKASIEYTNSNPKEASQLVVAAGMVEAAPVAEKAIPKCNIVYMDGDEMAAALDVFFAKLYEQDPKAVGGALPDSEIYLVK